MILVRQRDFEVKEALKASLRQRFDTQYSSNEGHSHNLLEGNNHRHSIRDPNNRVFTESRSRAVSGSNFAKIGI
jgi:hypothetical protein